MNYIMSGVFVITCYPILFIMYYMLKNASNRNGLCFGATLKAELRQAPVIQEIAEQFQKAMKRDLIVLAVIPVFFVIIPYFSISMSLWMIWILVICFLPCYRFAVANKKVKAVKQEQGWEEERRLSYSDLKTAALPRMVKWFTLLPPLVLSTIPMILAFVMFRGYGYGIYGFLIGCFTLCTYLFCLVATWTDRQKIVVICEDSDTNMNFARAKKQVWKKFSLISAWANTAFIWLMWYYMWKNGLAAAGIIWGTVIYGVLFVGIAFWTIKKLLDINRTYETKRTLVDQADDDKHWLWGMIYYNKNDKHIMTESRLGTGTSVNMATKTGWITTAISIVAIAAIPFVCIWMIMLEFTPIQVNIEKDTIICEQLSVEYEISFDEIESYEIITELPELTKVAGMGMDNVLSGTYEVYREGMYELFLNPQNGLFIKIFTGDRTYIISGADDAMTQMVLDSLETYIQ